MGILNRSTPALDSVVEYRSGLISIGDPAFADYFGLGVPNYTGAPVGEQSALSVSPVWRAVSLIVQTVASLPAGAVQHNPDGTRAKVPSWIDNPGGVVGLTPFEFWETTLLHLLLHGNSFGLQVRNAAGGMMGIQPLHPTAVSVRRENLMKIYRVTMEDGKVEEFTDNEVIHTPAMSTDGIRGLGPIQIARNSLGVTIAADRATGRMFSQGAFLQGIITPEEDVSETEAKEIKAQLDAKMAGWDNAGGFAMVNRKLKFQPWMMTNHDAQFLESRQFQVEEVARWFGVPPYELMQTEKQTSWGTGIEVQQRGLSRQVIGPWVRRIEMRMSTLLPDNRQLEFEFAALERPTPEQEIRLLIEQVNAGLLTPNEARAIRNLPGLPGGDALMKSAQTRPADETEKDSIDA